MKPMPPAVQQALIEAGRLDPDQITASIGRRARLRPCKRCWAWTVTGLDNDPAGLPAVADPAQVEPGAELVALLAGLASYDLIRGETRTGVTLQYRCPSRIAAPRQHLVLADHWCGNQSSTGVVPDLAVLRAVHARDTLFEVVDSEEVPF